MLHVREGSLPADISLILAVARSTSAGHNAVTRLITSTPISQRRIFLPMVRR